MISDIHRGIKFQSALPLAGSDVSVADCKVVGEKFQSALPLRGATTQMHEGISQIIFQSALPLRGATRVSRNQNWGE